MKGQARLEWNIFMQFFVRVGLGLANPRVGLLLTRLVSPPAVHPGWDGVERIAPWHQTHRDVSVFPPSRKTCRSYTPEEESHIKHEYKNAFQENSNGSHSGDQL